MSSNRNAPIRVLIAPDKFKGTLTAYEAAEAMRLGVRDFAAERDLLIDCILRPLADGGEGSRTCLRALHPDMRELQRVFPDSVGRSRQIAALVADEADRRSEYLETADIIGLELPGARDVPVPDRSTTGVGRYIQDAIDRAQADGVRELTLHLFLGGSATCDGGFHLARAIGFEFFDRNNRQVESVRELQYLNRIEPPSPPTILLSIRAFTDVQNELIGPNGAARLFAQQKGATPAEVEILEDALNRMGSVFGPGGNGDHVPPTARAPRYLWPGTGAAGGLIVPLLYWPGVDTRLESGIDFFLNEAGIQSELERSETHTIDCIVTGEGATDAGSLQGKVIAGLARLSREMRPDIPLVIVSGRIQDESRLQAAGLDKLFDTVRFCGALQADDWPLSPERATQRLRISVHKALSTLFPL
ncbi:MAG: glycerate kinase [Leptospiraceae bacterium]|nr:glycerate kinase [Leptospiraceae bacterium]